MGPLVLAGRRAEVKMGCGARFSRMEGARDSDRGLD